MALEKYPYNAYYITHVDSIQDDFPVTGLPLSDVALVGIAEGGTGDVVIKVTFSRKQDIIDGDATWIEYETIGAGESAVITLDPAPNGVLLEGSTAEAWIKGG